MIKSLKELIGFLYKFSSSYLVLSDKSSLLGYVRTEDILTLMNIGIDDVDKILTELKLKELSQIFNEKFSQSNLPLLILPQKDIDLISVDELKYFIKNESLKMNFETIVINFPLPVVITDRFGNIVFVNSKFCEIFGLDKESFLGIDLRNVIDVDKNRTIIKSKAYTLVSSTIIAFNVKVVVHVLY